MIDKRILNFLVIIILSLGTFWWTTFIFHVAFTWHIVLSIIALRMLSSIFIFKDYTLSWSKATTKTFLMKAIVVGIPLLLYAPYFYTEIRISFMLSEFFTYLVSINFLMYSYQYYVTRSGIRKTKDLVIYGAGKAGNKLEDEFRDSEYKIKYFVDDDQILQGRSIDAVKVLSKQQLKNLIGKDEKFDLLVIAMPSNPQIRIKEIHEKISPYCNNIKKLP